MNRKVLSLALLVSYFCFFHSQSISQTLYWGNPIEVAPNNYSNLRPQIQLNGSGNPIVLWGSSLGGRKGWVTTKDGTAFNPPTQANPTGTINAYTVEGPNMAARNDTAYLVYTTAPYTSAKIMLRRSFDGGLTWDTPIWVDSLGSDLPTFPSVAILPSGDPIVMYMRQQSNFSNPRYVSHRSNDLGQSWLPEVAVSALAPGNEVCDCCTGIVQASGNRVVAAFRNNDNNLRDVWMTISEDYGQSFSRRIDLDSTDWTTFVCPSSGPEFLLSNDSVHTVFMSRDQGPSRIFLTTAALNDSTISKQSMLDPTLPSNLPQNYPAIAGHQDTMGVVWSGHNGTDVDLMFSYKVGGQPWSQPRNVVGQAPSAQSYGSIAFQNGTFHIAYADNATGKVMYQLASFDQAVNTSPTFNSTFLVYPQPALGQVKIKMGADQPDLIYLLDQQGKRLRKITGIVEDFVLERDGLAAGMYLLEAVYPNGRTQVQKLIFD